MSWYEPKQEGVPDAPIPVCVMKKVDDGEVIYYQAAVFWDVAEGNAITVASSSVSSMATNILRRVPRGSKIEVKAGEGVHKDILLKYGSSLVELSKEEYEALKSELARQSRQSSE